MAKKEIIAIQSISDLHRLLRLDAPEHPLLSIVESKNIPSGLKLAAAAYCIDLYMIGFKGNVQGQFTYGRASYDFQEGTLICTGPGQVLSFDEEHENVDGSKDDWTLFFHADFVRNSNIATASSTYSFFSYEVNEALHLSEKEKVMLMEFVKNIKREISQNHDRHSRELMLINVESVLKYTSRFYDRQFYTRSNQTRGHVERFEHFLTNYFASTELSEKGLPSISRCGEALHMSGHYLSDLLKMETGKSAREHIHLRLIDLAKNQLLGSTASVSEIAYSFGFDYPQHFSKLFKTKTGMSPSEYRSLN